MPIPLLVWAVGAIAGMLFVGYKYGDKIEAYFKTEEGQKLLKDLSKVQKGYEAPYKKICDECKYMASGERQDFLRILKSQKMTSSDWIGLVAFADSYVKRDPSFIAVNVDIKRVDERS